MQSAEIHYCIKNYCYYQCYYSFFAGFELTAYIVNSARRWLN